MKYSGAFFEPPRPENRVPAGLLSYYQEKGYVAQAKKNGTSSVITVHADRTVTALTRDGTPHKAWAFTEESMSPFRSLPGSGIHVFYAELLHSKVSGLRDTNYVHDVLVKDGDRLVGTTFAQRHNMLSTLFPMNILETRWSHYVLPGRLWLARVTRPEHTDYQELFQSLSSPEDEGLVVKDMNGKLAMRGCTWAVKCRRATKNYGC